MRITLKEKHPELIGEWSKKNLPLTPDAVTSGSNRKVWWKGKCGHEWQAVIKNRSNGAGCPFCSGNKVSEGINDLMTVNPSLAAQWSERNRDGSPKEVSVYSNRRVWWRCSEGHEWLARVSDRTKGHGCPYCSGKTFQPGVNDLKTLYPDIAENWSEKNRLLKPDMVSPRSTDMVWWKCSKCYHEFEMTVAAMVRGKGCPVCADRKTAAGINDLATTDPVLSGEWDFEKNEKTPYEVRRSSSDIVWWKGKCGHEWRARISDRAIRNQACPVCEGVLRRELIKLLVMYYAGKMKIGCEINSTKGIGLELETYLPELRLAIEASSEESRVKTVKKYICEKHGIRYIDIDNRQPEEQLAKEIKRAFAEKNIVIKTDTDSDLAIIKSRYSAWRKSVERGMGE